MPKGVEPMTLKEATKTWVVPNGETHGPRNWPYFFSHQRMAGQPGPPLGLGSMLFRVDG